MVILVLVVRAESELQIEGVCLALCSRADLHWMKLCLYSSEGCDKTSLIWGRGEIKEESNFCSKS